MQTLVIGLGTGRCGTASLAAFLMQQPYADVSHEFRLLPWTPHAPRFDTVFRSLLARPGRVIGDVASYWLPYIPLLATRVARHPEIRLRIIHLTRPTAQVVPSFMERTRGRDHWCAGQQTGDKFDECFPKYPLTDKAEAITRYCADYARQYEDFRLQNAGLFYDMATDDLSSVPALHALLDWLGLPIIEVEPVHVNRGASPAAKAAGAHSTRVRTKSRFGVRSRFGR